VKLRFFVVPMLDGEEESRELNTFLAMNRVMLVERHFVADGPRSAWAICVSYLDRGARPAREQGQGKRLDYREILSESDFAVYAKLRSLRKSMAEKNGLPAYAFFTNEQLAAMVQQRVTSLIESNRSDQSERSRNHRLRIPDLAGLDPPGSAPQATVSGVPSPLRGRVPGRNP
jgi:superfamily II DNA helicase RecQ